MASMLYYVKDKFVPAAEAMIHVSERGFRFGDGVFETIKLTQGVPIHCEQHLERLTAGAKALGFQKITQPLPDIIKQLIQKNTLSEGTIRLSASRGIGSSGYMPLNDSPPTVVLELLPLTPISHAPLKLCISNIQKLAAHSLPVAYKLSQGVNSTLARMQADALGCDEAIMLNAQGEVCEATSANLFWLKDNTLYTPALECGLLAGTARANIINHWPHNIEQGRYTVETLYQAEVVFLTNAIKGATAVNELYDAAGTKQKEWDSAIIAQNANQLLQQAESHYLNEHHARWAV